MTRIITLVILIVGTVSMLQGQTASDALRYSYLNPVGTARAAGVGGAMGALGADFTTLSVNPAGIGGFWKSEFVFSGVLLRANTKSTLENGIPSEELSSQFNVGTVGLVFANQPRKGNWKSVGFGFGLNRMATYTQEFFFRGETNGTIVDRFAGLAFGLTPDELDAFEAGLAFETGAIFDLEDDGLYETDFIGEENELFRKQQLVRTTGYSNEMVINFGGNYKDKLLLGATVGIPFILFESEKIYEESDAMDVVPAFNNLRFDEFLRTEGSGVNFKLGAIVKLNQRFRIGAAFHSPTILNLTDRFSTSLEYSFRQGNTDESFTSLSPEGEFEYSLNTPWRVVGSAAALIGKRGFISADLEYVDYSSAKFDLTKNSDNTEDRIYQDFINNDIEQSYSGALNIKLGGELVWEMLRLRGGVQLLGSPFESDNTTQEIVSVGAGIRGNKVFLDLAFLYNSEKERYLPYLIEDAPLQTVENKINRTQLIATVGFKL
ncbi:MAG: outer membrane protein transport protein [Saprospiraceae bacterium]|nr:outer membrane protein transport protein [Saprospiraceae bacterium]